jgi:GMP synthase PP-ATPase subunit
MEVDAQTETAQADASCEPLEAAQRRVRQLKAAQQAKEDAHALAVVLPVIRELETTGVRGDNRAIAQALNNRGVRTAELAPVSLDTQLSEGTEEGRA